MKAKLLTVVKSTHATKGNMEQMKLALMDERRVITINFFMNDVLKGMKSKHIWIRNILRQMESDEQVAVPSQEVDFLVLVEGKTQAEAVAEVNANLDTYLSTLIGQEFEIHKQIATVGNRTFTNYLPYDPEAGAALAIAEGVDTDAEENLE